MPAFFQPQDSICIDDEGRRDGAGKPIWLSGIFFVPLCGGPACLYLIRRGCGLAGNSECNHGPIFAGALRGIQSRDLADLGDSFPPSVRQPRSAKGCDTLFVGCESPWPAASRSCRRRTFCPDPELNILGRYPPEKLLAVAARPRDWSDVQNYRPMRYGP